MRVRLCQHDRSGTAMVEFVIVVGIVLLLLFAVVDIGLLLNAQLTLTAAVREGARRAAVEGGATAGAYERVFAQLSLGNVDPAKASVEIHPRWAPYGSQVRVSVAYPYLPATPLVRAIAGNKIELRATAVSRSEKTR